MVTASASSTRASFVDVIADVQPKLVKIYGAGGISGLESYQSGFLISADGHILTVWSYVLDTDYITAVLNDGRRFQAELVGADPRLEIAVLKIDATDLPYFDLATSSSAVVGDRVLAFSNLFGIATGNEPASVLHGHVSAITDLTARRGVYETIYNGSVYVVDAMTNNSGAAGGVLTDRQGQLLGVLGKELRNSLNHTWLNYAMPISELQGAVEDVISGKFRPRHQADDVRRPAQPMSLDLLGIVLVPDVLNKTPAFIDRVRHDSPAEVADLRPDDLVVLVGSAMVQSQQELVNEVELIDRLDPVRLTVLRDQQLIEIELTVDE